MVGGDAVVFLPQISTSGRSRVGLTVVEISICGFPSSPVCFSQSSGQSLVVWWLGSERALPSLGFGPISALVAADQGRSQDSDMGVAP